MSASLVLYFDDDLDTPAALTPVAGVPLFKRIVLEARRAGVREFLVVAGRWKVHIESELDEDRRLAGAVHWMGALTAATLEALSARIGDEVLLVRSNALVDHRCLAALLAHPRGRALAIAPAAGGRPDPVVLRGGHALLSDLLTRLSRDGATFRQVLERLVGEERVEPMELTRGVCQEVRGTGDLARLEPELYRGLGIRDDSALDRTLTRRISRLLTRGLARRPITPSQISLLSLAVGLLSAWVFWSPSPLRAALGLLLYQVSVILDHAGGETARLKFLESPWGGHLDFAVETVIPVALTLAMADIAGRLTGIPGLFTAGAAAAVGVAASALVVHALSGAGRGKESGALARLADRDVFSLVLLAYLVLMGSAPRLLAGLLGLLAVGANGFWPAYLIGVGAPRIRTRLSGRQLARPWAGLTARSSDGADGRS